MRKSKKIKELDKKVFELETRVDLLTMSLDNLILSQGLDPNLDSKKWYKDLK
jgi:hypothetical protein